MGTVLSMESYVQYSPLDMHVDKEIHHGIGKNKKKREDSISAKNMTTDRCIQSIHCTNMCTEVDEQRMCVG